jgi:3-hydroxyisobutyrate dehydrogenase
MTTVGFVGLGSMGAALAQRLVDRVPLVVYDRDPHQRQAFAHGPATIAASLDDVARASDTVVLCLPTSAHVRDVLCDPDGLATGLRPGSLVIDCTSGDPELTRQVAEQLQSKDIRYIDAPVSGGPQAAASGSIAIIVGGSAPDFERARATLTLISPNVRHVGPVGAGHCVKALNNLLAAGHRMLAFETAAIAAVNGVDPQTYIDVVNISSGRSYATEVTMPRHVFSGQLMQGFSLGLMAKDVAIAASLIPSEARATALAGEVDVRIAQALEHFGPAADINRILESYEEAYHVALQSRDR